ncbi:sugar transferase [Streptococcus suis]|uniref:sugar transferase n=1 Tax=Streptococcus suis TaxID=1307 RepID=UPI001C95876C|nr:sugar transferase [Streptococcus suis]MBY5014090.1 sugar transferase [Streptococcus suis]
MNKGLYEKYFKRLLDILLSLFAIILLFPIILIVSIFVYFKLGSPVLFKQKRPGKDEKIFKMYKFRTMTDEKDEKGELLPDSVRLTAFGKWLRSTSLDELPELFNILKGDMSIVGPRPQLVRDMFFMSAEQRKRHEVLPGLTGLAQVSGRNNITWEQKFEYDLEYIERVSLLKDLDIIRRTIFKVIAKSDISTDGMDTAEDFGDYLLRTHQISKEEYKMNMKIAKELLDKQFDSK